MNVAELRLALDELGVPYRSRDRKAVLEQLHLDATQIDTPQQLHLAGVEPRKLGPVERASREDMTVLNDLGVIPAGSKALEATYRRLARQIDKATDEDDRYGVINSARELRQLRAGLGVTTGGADDDALREFMVGVLEAVTESPPT